VPLWTSGITRSARRSSRDRDERRFNRTERGYRIFNFGIIDPDLRHKVCRRGSEPDGAGPDSKLDSCLRTRRGTPHQDCDPPTPPLTLEPRKPPPTKQVPQPRDPGAGLTLDRLSPEPPVAPAETSSTSQTGRRFHNKKAGIRAAVILIGLLHKSRNKAKEKEKEREREREREENEGWVKFVPYRRLMA